MNNVGKKVTKTELRELLLQAFAKSKKSVVFPSKKQLEQSTKLSKPTLEQ